MVLKYSHRFINFHCSDERFLAPGDSEKEGIVGGCADGNSLPPATKRHPTQDSRTILRAKESGKQPGYH